MKKFNRTLWLVLIASFIVVLLIMKLMSQSEQKKQPEHSLRATNGKVYDANGKDVTTTITPDSNLLKGRIKADKVVTPLDSNKPKEK
jgi:hypothetical protein